MKPFHQEQGIVVPIDQANVDTDAIIAKQYLKSIKRSGFGVNLFDNWRYLDPGAPDIDNATRRVNPQFVLNQPRYANASILLARKNFGCGSSREHAVWALDDYGIRAVIAPSFADIFFNNCFKSGLLPIVLDEQIVDGMFARVAALEGYRLHIDLPEQKVTDPDGESFTFELDGFRKQCLLEGLDDIGVTLQHAEAIRDYEARRREQAPWLFEEHA
ncbi:MAG: 3-isopropylmalate dehydratase small subunit [Gammaproteobacteria bacterium]|nr:3-isopropylmalate dehydratase small subunit [Gammaproteobacteria bacterium]